MPRLPLVRVELDLRIEHASHEAVVNGGEGNITVRFPTLASLLHFATMTRPWWGLIPRAVPIRVEYQGWGWWLRRPPN